MLRKCLYVFGRLKMNHGNFRVEIPETDPTTLSPAIPKELIEQKSKGRPMSSPQQEKVIHFFHRQVLAL